MADAPVEDVLLAEVEDDEDGEEQENNPALLTVQTLRDNIVSAQMLRIYTSDLQQFLRWLQINENRWLTPHGNQRKC